MNRDVFLSLLALDSYNRGYGENVNGLDVVANITRIGNATIKTDSEIEIGDDARAAGFYAIAYEWQGETIISYRGTDNISLESQSDVWTGWSLGGGFPAGSQAIAANDNRQHIRQAA